MTPEEKRKRIYEDMERLLRACLANRSPAVPLEPLEGNRGVFTHAKNRETGEGKDRKRNA